MNLPMKQGDGGRCTSRQNPPSRLSASGKRLICETLKAREVERLAPEAAKARGDFIARRATELADRTGLPQQDARDVVSRQCEGVLLPDLLPFDSAELSGRTVADVLADPLRFEGETLSDPLEGPDYGTGKAKV